MAEYNFPLDKTFVTYEIFRYFFLTLFCPIRYKFHKIKEKFQQILAKTTNYNGFQQIFARTISYHGKIILAGEATDKPSK